VGTSIFFLPSSIKNVQLHLLSIDSNFFSVKGGYNSDRKGNSKKKEGLEYRYESADVGSYLRQSVFVWWVCHLTQQGGLGNRVLLHKVAIHELKGEGRLADASRTNDDDLMERQVLLLSPSRHPEAIVEKEKEQALSVGWLSVGWLSVGNGLRKLRSFKMKKKNL